MMKKKTSSPAPWKYEYTWVYDADEQEVCEVFGADDDATDANGRLIEAAPSMKKVLQHYLSLLRKSMNGDNIANCKLYEDLMMIEDVLKKAGE